MEQLYSVEIHSKHIVSSFNAKGEKTGEKIDVIKQTINDLPHSTAMMYKEKTQGNCVITKQAIEYSPGRDPRGRGLRTNKKPAVVLDVKPATPRPAKKTTVQQAAMSGDMAAAINAGN